MGDDRVHKHVERALQGNLEKERDKLARQNKMFVRDRLDRLLDPGSFAEDGLLANALADSLPADGVVTGMGRIDGRPVCVMANDPTVKAGSWGARTVEKILRLTESALRHEDAGGICSFFLGQALFQLGRLEDASEAFNRAATSGFSETRVAAWQALPSRAYSR